MLLLIVSLFGLAMLAEMLCLLLTVVSVVMVCVFGCWWVFVVVVNSVACCNLLCLDMRDVWFYLKLVFGYLRFA